MKKLSCVMVLLCACAQQSAPNDQDTPPGDDKSDGIGTSPTGATRWMRASSGTGESAVVGLATDTDGSVVVVGWFTKSFEFGSGYVSSHGDRDIFVTRFDRDGVAMWTRSFGASSNDTPVGVGIAADHSVLVFGTVGSTETTPVFAGAPLGASGTTVVPRGTLARYSADGDELAARAYGYASVPSIAIAMTVDDDEVMLVIHSTGRMDLGGVAIEQDGGYLARLDLDGEAHWVRSFDANVAGSGIAVDAEQVVVASGFYNTVDLGAPSDLVSFGTTQTSALVAYDRSTGAYLWHHLLGGPAGGDIRGVSRAPDGSFWTTGSFEGTGYYGGGKLTAANRDGFLARFEADGAPIASVASGEAIDERLFGAAALSDRGVAVAGYDVDEATLVHGFVRRSDEHGQLVWQHDLGSATCAAIEKAPNGDLVVGGRSSARVPATDGAPLFVHRLAP